MPNFHKWLEFALRNWEEHMVCGVAVGVVGDICRALGDKILPYCDVIVGLLNENLRVRYTAASRLSTDGLFVVLFPAEPQCKSSCETADTFVLW